MFSELTIVESKFCTEAIYPPETVENFETIDLHFRRTSQTQFTSQTGLETTITTAINPEFGTFPQFLTKKFMIFSQQLKTNFVQRGIYPPETVENFETIDLHFRRTSQTQFTSQTGLETTITTAINPEFGTFPKFLYKFMFFFTTIETQICTEGGSTLLRR